MSDHNCAQITPKEVLDVLNESVKLLISRFDELNTRLDAGLSRIDEVSERLGNLERMLNVTGNTVPTAKHVPATVPLVAASQQLTGAAEPIQEPAATAVSAIENSEIADKLSLNRVTVNLTSATSTTQEESSKAVSSATPASSRLPNSSNGTSFTLCGNSRLLNLFPTDFDSSMSRVDNDQAKAPDVLAPLVTANATTQSSVTPPPGSQVSIAPVSLSSTPNPTTPYQSSTAPLSPPAPESAGFRVSKEIVPKPNPEGRYSHCKPAPIPNSCFRDGPPKNDRRGGNRQRAVFYNNQNSTTATYRTANTNRRNSPTRTSTNSNIGNTVRGNGGGPFDPREYFPFLPHHLRQSSSNQNSAEGSINWTRVEDLGPSVYVGAASPPN